MGETSLGARLFTVDVSEEARVCDVLSGEFAEFHEEV
jgi:hypothetical protein